MKIFCKFPIVNISKLNNALLRSSFAQFKGVFFNLNFFLHPQIADFEIAVSQANIVFS